jgi:Arc/MetJ-type ribon-helix-helix transcriptional regulator
MSAQTQAPAGGLTAENEEFIERAIAQGRYQSRDDALNDGVQLLRVEELKRRLAESRRQLDEGEYTEYDDGGLDAYFEELKQRARNAGKRHKST